MQTLAFYQREPNFTNQEKILIITFITGGGSLNSLVFSVKSSILSVADMIISLNGFPRFLLKGTIRDKRPSRMSVYTLRSWASSMMTTEYLLRRKSVWISFKRTPGKLYDKLRQTYIIKKGLIEIKWQWAQHIARRTDGWSLVPKEFWSDDLVSQSATWVGPHKMGRRSAKGGGNPLDEVAQDRSLGDRPQWTSIGWDDDLEIVSVNQVRNSNRSDKNH